MGWYYFDGKTQHGPVTDDELRAIAKTPIFTPETLVWQEGLADWIPFQKAFPEISPKKSKATFKSDQDSSTPLQSGQHVCAITGNIYTESDMIRFGEVWVSKDNKDKYLRYLLQNGHIPGTVDHYAGFGVRALALTIDQLILCIPGVFLFWGMGGWTEIQNMFNAISAGVEIDPVALQQKFYLYWVIILLITSAYFIFFTGKYSASPGKIICRIKVVKADGTPIGYGLSTFRYLASLVSSAIFYLGYLSVFCDNQERTLHDLLCNTRVIKID